MPSAFKVEGEVKLKNSFTKPYNELSQKIRNSSKRFANQIAKQDDKVMKKRVRNAERVTNAIIKQDLKASVNLRKQSSNTSKHVTNQITKTNEKLKSSTKKAANSIVKQNRKVRESFGKVIGKISGVQLAISALGSVLTIGAISSFISKIADAGEEINNLRRVLNFASGSAEEGAKSFQLVRDTSKLLGLELTTTGSAFSKLSAASRGSELQGRKTEEIFLGIVTASKALNLSADQTAGAIRAIEQMISKGKITAEELRGQLGERLPGAFQIMARALGKTTQELDKMLQKGELSASDALPKFAKFLREDFTESAILASKSLTSVKNRFRTSVKEIMSSIAESGVTDGLINLFETLNNTLNNKSVIDGAKELGNAIRVVAEELASVISLGEKTRLDFASKEDLKEARSIMMQLAQVERDIIKARKESSESGLLGRVLPRVTKEEVELNNKKNKLRREFKSLTGEKVEDVTIVQITRQIANLNKEIVDAKRNYDDLLGKGGNESNKTPSITGARSVEGDRIHFGKISEFRAQANQRALAVIRENEKKAKEEQLRNIEEVKNKMREMRSEAAQITKAYGQVGLAGANAFDSMARAMGFADNRASKLISTLIKAVAQAVILKGVLATTAAPLQGPTQATGILNIVSTLFGGFANGGIVNYGRSTGDQTLARVNRGEMILNKQQQANLFKVATGESNVSNRDRSFKIGSIVIHAPSGSGKEIADSLANRLMNLKNDIVESDRFTPGFA